ncbi:MAG: hypothetical protein HQL32_17610, partial [Planctomycetes bacterium]|nr:hypothetical protein [Planctomycetota bacterium]
MHLFKKIFSAFWISLITFSSYAADTGEAHIYVFKDDGDVFQGVSVECGSAKAITDSSGFAMLKLPVGKQLATLKHEGKVVTEIPLSIVKGDSVEAMLTVNTKKEVAVDVIAEEAKKEEKKEIKITAKDAVGKIQGIIKDVKTGKGIKEARIFIRGVSMETSSNDKGEFEFTLPVGEYD